METISLDDITGQGSFTCCHCGQPSRLARYPEKPGLYKITCFNCQKKTYLQVARPQADINETFTAKIEEKRQQQQEKPANETISNPTLTDEEPKQTTPLPTEEQKPIAEQQPPETLQPFPNDTAEQRIVQQKLWQKEQTFPQEQPVSTEPENLPTPKRDYLWEKNIPLFLRSKAMLAIVLFSIFIFAGLIAGFIAGYSDASQDLDPLLAELSKNKPSIVYDRNGKILSEIYQKKTGTTKLDEYPPELIKMLLAVEDRNFYEHSGIDYIAIGRAFFKNISALEYSQGASTITMQLARILIKDRRKSMIRKLREAFIALAIESRLNKKQILQAYMNQVYLGHGAFGFENATKYYFQKSLKELTTSEMILLASLPSAPNRYSPFKNSRLSRKRYRILTAMLTKNNIIPSGQMSKIHEFFNNLKKPPYKTVFAGRLDAAPYVTEHIRAILLSVNPDKDIYYEGGFKIETTVELAIQKSVIEEIESYTQKRRQQKRFKKQWLGDKTKKPQEEPVLQAAVIGLDPQTGEVLYMHGGGDKFSSDNQFNRAIQMRRQTGSSIKPILYSAAIDTGTFHTGMKILDAPLLYRGKNGGADWMPSNYGKVYEGEIFLRTALVKSKNTAAVQIAEKLGLPTVKKYFARFFFPDEAELQRRYRDDLSVSLGTIELSPLEMAMVYSAFANDGIIKRPYLIKKIYSADGKLIYSFEDKDEFQLRIPPERRVIKPDTAQVMISLMKSSGVASRVRSTGYRGIIAGKTGTTNDYRDAWYVGTRPNLSMAIWLGYDNPSFGMGPRGVGSELASPLWGTIARNIDKLEVLEKRSFQFSKKAKWLRICKESGTLASKCNCLETKREIFTRAHSPSSECKFNPLAIPEDSQATNPSSLF